MKIKFSYSFLLVAIGFLLTGYFENLIIFTSIIMIHELGHFITAKYYKIKIEKLTIYPYGGLLQMNKPINTKISHDLKIAVSGVITQSLYYFIIFFLYKIKFLREYTFKIFTMYNSNMFFFNLLPIYPLDGSIILELLLSKIIPYKKTLKINILISCLILTIFLFLNIKKANYTIILIISIIINNIYKLYKNIDLYYNKFLLERYLYNYKYKKHKIISNINNMYKERTHTIKIGKKYTTEKQNLKNKYER